jgi:hypothetical protein
MYLPTQIIPNVTSKLLISSDEVSVDTNQILGEGGFGTVYVGLLRGSTKVAVKKIKGLDEAGLRGFAREVQQWEGLVQRNGWLLFLNDRSPRARLTTEYFVRFSQSFH